MTKLQGKNAYEMINHATGKLAGKLQQLIEDYGDSALVSELADEFISWWYMSFDDPDKDSIGRGIWDKADEIRASLGNADPNEAIAMTKLEKAGNAVGNVIGKVTGVATNATIAGATATNKWIRVSATPTIKAGSKELWKGLKATAKATRDSYIQSRVKATELQPDDETPY